MWGEIEAEPEVDAWLTALTEPQFGQAAFYIDLLAERGTQLNEPYTRQLRGKLRKLRFYLDGERFRVSYCVTGGRRSILLTEFRKVQRRAPAEIERAWQAMQRCIREGHMAEDDDGG